MADLDIGLGKSARQGFDLAEVALVPGRRTRDTDLVDLSWELDAFRFDLPFLAAPLDGIVSPETAAQIGAIGGGAVLDLEGLWTRHDDPGPLIERIIELPDQQVTSELQKLYAEPIKPELVRDRIKEIRAAGVVSCGAVTPQRTVDLADVLVKAELDLVVIHGTVVSAEHVTGGAEEPLNLKTFVRRLDIPVVVGGATSYQGALHLMRSGAAGVLVGSAGASDADTAQTLGIGLPQATAIADVRAARMRHLDETGVYVQVIAAGPVSSGGDIAKAVALGADGVLLGPPLAASDTPGRGYWWPQTAAHQVVPRGRLSGARRPETLAQVVTGPGTSVPGTNLMGSLRSAMAMAGFESLKQLQKAELVVRRRA
ncbi:MAG: GuaB3 family IMP dehydrogenase-related protein [Acidimicrobiales bacterium]